MTETALDGPWSGKLGLRIGWILMKCIQASVTQRLSSVEGIAPTRYLFMFMAALIINRITGAL